MTPRWNIVPLGELADITSGLTKNSKKVRAGTRLVPYLRVANVQRGYLDLREVQSIEATQEEVHDLRLRAGDILFNEGGDRDKLGRGWVWEGQIPECIHQNHVFRARLRSRDHDPRFVSYFANSDRGRRYFLAFGKQTTNLASINQGVLKALPVPLPSPSEQRQIVAEIETQFSRLDDAVATLERVRARVRRARAAVLHAAVTGNLVPTEAELARREGRAYEPGDVVLGRMLSTRAAASAGRKMPPLVDPVLGDAPAAPEGWAWTSVDAAGDVLLGRQRAPQYLTGRFFRPYLRVANVKDDRIDLDDVEEMDFDAAHFEKYALTPGDILVSEGQSLELVGQSAIYRGGVEGLCFQKTLHRFRSMPHGPSPEFAQLVFRAWVYTGVFKRFASITTNIAHLTLAKFRACPFPLPPVAEQVRIVDEVARRLAALDDVDRMVAASLARCDQLRQSILKLAFEGRLLGAEPIDLSTQLPLLAAEPAP